MIQQMYVAQPMDDLSGRYQVAKLVSQGTENVLEGDYLPLKGEIYPTEDDAKLRANVLNQEYLIEIRQNQK